MSTDTAPRVGLYARVSGDHQVKEQTIASQIAAIEERIGQSGWTCDREMHFIDDGYRGGTLHRPALERLRDVAAVGGLDRLYVHSPDRLARKYAYQVVLVEELQRCGVEIVFLNQKLGTSPEEELLLQMQGMIAEYERAKIVERTRRGKRYAARRGMVNVLSSAPYGYRYLSKPQGGGQASYQVILEEARVVRRVFAWVGEQRLSIREVSRRLAREGIPSPAGKASWQASTVSAMLRNPAYKGKAAFGKTRSGERLPRLRPYRGCAEQPRRPWSVYAVPSDEWTDIPVPSLVSEALFAAVGEQLAENQKRRRESRRGALFLLQGLLVCRRCCYAWYGKASRTDPASSRPMGYYRCGGRDTHRCGGQRLCDNPPVRTDVLDAAVWEDVSALLKEPERMRQEYQRRLKPDESSGTARGAVDLSQVTRQVQRAIARLIDAYEAGLLDRAEFEPRIRAARDRLAKLQEEARTLADEQTQHEHLRLVIGDWEAFADRVRDVLETLDWTARREIIRTVVKQVELDNDQIHVVYRVSPSPAEPRSIPGIRQDCTRSASAGVLLTPRIQSYVGKIPLARARGSDVLPPIVLGQRAGGIFTVAK
jgi:site-specific DNA recombinase